VASDPIGALICSPPFDLSLAPQHAGDAMRITLFAPFYRGNLSFCRVEQIPIWHHQLDLDILHGDGTNTVAKKGGDGIGYSGHKHQTGEKIIAIVDNNGFVLAPLPVAPVNETDTTPPRGIERLEARRQTDGPEN